MAQSYGSLRTNAGLYGAGNDAETIAFNQRLIEQDMQANPWKYDGSSYQRQAQEIARGNQFVMDLNTQPGGGASWGGAASSQGLGRFSAGQQTPRQLMADSGTWYADPASAQWSNTQVRPREGGQSGVRAGADDPSLRLPGNTGARRISTAPTNPDGSPQQGGAMAQPYQNPTYTSPMGVPYGMTTRLSSTGEPMYPAGVRPPTTPDEIAAARAQASQYMTPAGMGNPFTPGAGAPAWGTPGQNFNAGGTTAATTPRDGLAMYGAGHTSYGQGNNPTYAPEGERGGNGEWVTPQQGNQMSPYADSLYDPSGMYGGNRPQQGQGAQPTGYAGYNMTGAPPPRPTYGNATGGSGMWTSDGAGQGMMNSGGLGNYGGGAPPPGMPGSTGAGGMPVQGQAGQGGRSVGIGRQTGISPTVTSWGGGYQLPQQGGASSALTRGGQGMMNPALQYMQSGTLPQGYAMSRPRPGSFNSTNPITGQQFQGMTIAPQGNTPYTPRQSPPTYATRPQQGAMGQQQGGQQSYMQPQQSAYGSTSSYTTRQKMPTQTYVNGQQYSTGTGSQFQHQSPLTQTGGYTQASSFGMQPSQQQSMTRDMVTGDFIPAGTETNPKNAAAPLRGTTATSFGGTGYSDYKGPPQGSLAYLAADAAKHPNSAQAAAYATRGTNYQHNWSPLDIQNFANTNRLRR